MRQRPTGRVLQQVSGLSFRAILIASFVVALGLLFFGRGNGAIFGGARGLVDNATAGLYSFVGPPIATGRQFVGNALRIFEVYRENDQLSAENAQLKAWQAAGARAPAEGRALRGAARNCRSSPTSNIAPAA